MKRKLCLLLVLSMVLGLMAGCGKNQPGGEVGADTEASADTLEARQENLGVPRKAGDLVPRLNEALKAQGIPLEFILEEEVTYQVRESENAPIEDRHYDWYLAAFTDSGKAAITETFDLSVYYPTSKEDNATIMQIWIGENATERERELHPVVCAVAAQLCDPRTKEETIDSLFSAEPTPTYYITQAGDVGTFTYKDEIYGGPATDYDYSVAFCQGEDMTHTISRRLTNGEQWYEIYFGESPESLYGERLINGISVEELEQGLNDAFAAMGVPVVCAFTPYHSYGYWGGYFRYTTLDDPDYTYPEYPYELWEMSPEEVTQEMIDQYRTDSLNGLVLDVRTIDPLRKDAPIDYMSFWSYGTLPELGEALFRATHPENGEEEFKAFQALPIVKTAENEDEPQERTLEKEGCTITEYVYPDDGSSYYRYEYDIFRYWNVVIPSGEALMDPELIDYEFMLSGPMIENGVFNYYNQSQQTIFYGSTNGVLYLSDLINDYLDCTCSNVFVSGYWDDAGEHYAIHEGNRGEELDRGTFRIDVYSVAVDVFYNENIENYIVDDGMYRTPDIYNFLRIPIGISRIFDQSMTWEDAIALHTQSGDYDFIATDDDYLIAPAGYQVTVYDSEDVVHILAEDPETGNHQYSVAVRDYVLYDYGYAHLLEYLDN